jgi:hypothetical protein
MLRSLSAALAAALFAAPAQAAPDEAAFALFEAGQFQIAAETAAAKGDAENLALAARALNALAYLQTDDDVGRRIAGDALDYAEAAIAADDALVEGHLQAAISLAQRGSRMAALRAFFLGIADRAREELDDALAREPQNPWALSSSAAWHLEVARRVGDGRFGSNPDLGYRQFMAARDIDPDNLLIAYECALRLIAYDEPEWRAAGLAALDAVIAGEPSDAFETAIRMRAEAFAAAIAAGRKAERKFISAQP